MKVPRVRKGQGEVSLDRAEFDRRFLADYHDPAFEKIPGELRAVADVAWDGYHEYRKSPRTRPAGPEFADPEFDLPIEWLETRAAIARAQREHDDPAAPGHVLIVCGAARHDKTCPGEMSKTFRLAAIARDLLAASGDVEVDFLDMSMLTAQYGRVIYPCKACVSTAMPLCHWPCSCYPNHAMGQTGDWMNEIYPRWVRAHGVLIVTPVYWYQAPSVLKLMIDRLVCADGGNPDPTRTKGKSPELAKTIELEGWSYPRHLGGRAFAVVVHGDATGVDVLRRSLTDWLLDMHLIQAGRLATLGRYVGYYEPYATSHDALDADEGVRAETETAARSLLETVRRIRRGEKLTPELEDPRPK